MSGTFSPELAMQEYVIPAARPVLQLSCIHIHFQEQVLQPRAPSKHNFETLQACARAGSIQGFSNSLKPGVTKVCKLILTKGTGKPSRKGWGSSGARAFLFRDLQGFL